MTPKHANHWDRYSIKAEINRRGSSLVELAREYSITPNSLRVTLARQRPVVKADLVISDFLKVPLHVLWPDRYDDKGNRLVRVGTLKVPVGIRKRTRRRRS